MAKGYITAIEVATALGLDYTDSQIILDVSLAIEYVEDAVDQYCNTTFVDQVGAVKIYSGTGLPIINLGDYLRTLTSVWILNEDGTEATQLTDVVPMPQPAKNGVYRWLERRQNQYPFFEPANTFPNGLNNIKVTGNWGFTSTPSAIKLAVIAGVKHFFDLRNKNDVISIESGFGRMIEQSSPDKVRMLPLHARVHLDYWRVSTWTSE